MNKTELIAAAAEATGLTKKDAERVLNAAIDAVTVALVKGEKVQISVDGGMPMTGVKVDLADPDSTLVTLTNAPAAKLPATGGSGTLPYTLGGSLLIAVGVALMYTILKRRREEEITP